MKNWKPVPPRFAKNKNKEFVNAAKTSQFIYTLGESQMLRQKSKEVKISEINSPEFQKKIKYIKSMMRKYRNLTGVGRGITAVQIGIPQRFSVVYTPEKLLIIINPKITKKSSEKYTYPEICMSAQPIIAQTARPAWIEFEYLNEKGEKIIWDTKDKTKIGKMLNRVFQHEIDHMDGIINIDYLRGSDLFFDVDPKFYQNAKFTKVKS